MRWPPAEISIRSPMPIHATFRKLPPALDPSSLALVVSGKKSPPCTKMAALLETVMR